MKYVLALDQGTTSSRAILFDEAGGPLAVGQREFRQIFPQAGWVEHDPREIFATQRDVARDALRKSNIPIKDVMAIGITNQRETTILWDRQTGEPIHNAIVWQDRRTAALCKDLKEVGAESLVRERTGLVIDPYFSGTKIAWLLDEIPGARGRAERGELAFGMVPAGTFGEPLVIAGIAGDQQAAMFGQGCHAPGMAKNTYGTGCFMLHHLVAGVEKHGLIATACAQTRGKEYALEGSVFIGGAVVQWLRDQLGFFSSSSEVERLAAEVMDCGDVFVVPAFTGLGAPYWDPDARGTIIGLTRGTTKAHIARAALESIAFQSAEVLEAMQKDSGENLAELRVDGGAAANDLLMQFQADLLGVPVVRPRVLETTALGAAYLAGLTVDLWKSREELAQHWQAQRRFEPQMDPAKRQALMGRWREAVSRARNWAVAAT